MKRLAIILLLLLFSGESRGDTTAFNAPNGAKVYTTKCTENPESCYSEARQSCRGSYQILNSESHAGGFFGDAIPGPVTWYSMQYQCGPSDGRLASFPHRGTYYVPPRLHTNFCEFNYNDIGCVGVY